MNENQRLTPHKEDEDLSPSFTQTRRPVPARRVSPRTEEVGRGAVPTDPATPAPIRKTEAPRGYAEHVKKAERIAETASEDGAPTETTPLSRKRGALLSPRTKRITYLAGAFVLCLTLLVVLGNALFSVREITVFPVDGMLGWTEKGILEAAGVAVGDPMRSVKAKEISARISDAFPALSGAEITKSFPGKVVIIPRTATPSYRFTFDGTTYILSKELKVLAEDDGDHGALPELLAFDISACEIGEILSFSDTRDYTVIKETAERIVDEMGETTVDRIDISDPFSIVVFCEGKYKLLFGDKNELEQKVKLVKETLRDPMFSGEATAVIDVSSGNKASVKFTGIGKLVFPKRQKQGVSACYASA